jgi:hypothetical protein
LAEGVSEVGLGDVFVYGFSRSIQVAPQFLMQLAVSCIFCVNFQEGWL